MFLIKRHQKALQVLQIRAKIMKKNVFQNKNFMILVRCPIRYHLCFEQKI